MEKQTEDRGQKTEVKLQSWLFIVWMMLWLAYPAETLAQTATPFVTTVTVTVLDENGEPVAFLPIELHMFDYTENLEAVAVGGCGTDESGSCSIEVVDPPSLGSWMEGMIYIPGLGMEYIGWRENIKMVVIQLLPGNVMATPETFLHFPIEGQDETGTDVPLALAASLTLAPTRTPSETSQPTDTHTQTPGPALTATEIPTETPTATPTPATILGGDASGTNDLLWLALVGAGVAAGVWWFVSQRSRRLTQKRSAPQDEEHRDA